MPKNTKLHGNFTIQSKGMLLSLAEPIIMGILNATPDSFYHQNKEDDLPFLVQKATQMINDGATIIDIGGATSKPNATPVNPSEEIKRVIPLIKTIAEKHSTIWISIDTFHAEVAAQAIAAGAHIVNDISAGCWDPEMLKMVAQLHVPYVIMHSQGKPDTMQINPQYNQVVFDVYEFLKERILACKAHQIYDLIVDVGFGFGKTIAHNFELLNHLATFLTLEKPLLVGISRKSMIYKTLNTTPEHALNGTTALHMIALQSGAKILRVHDVKEAAEVIQLWRAIAKNSDN